MEDWKKLLHTLTLVGLLGFVSSSKVSSYLLQFSRPGALQSTVVEEEEDGVIYTVVVRQQHGVPNSPTVSCH